MKSRTWHKSIKMWLDNRFCGDGIEILPGDLIEQLSTGKFDKNGTEIYEGDIIDTGKRFAEVYWDKDWAAFRLRGLRDTKVYTDYENLLLEAHLWIVAGNIFTFNR